MKKLTVFNAEYNDLRRIYLRSKEPCGLAHEVAVSQTKENIDGFVERGISAFPTEIKYPVLALFTNYQENTDQLIISKRRGDGGRTDGAARYWSQDFDASTPEGLARAIGEELSREPSQFEYKSSVSCVIDLTDNHSTAQEAYEILRKDHGYEVIQKIVPSSK